MDKIVTFIQSTNYNDNKEVNNLVGILNKQQDLFAKNPNTLDDLLSIIDPKLHSLGWVFILSIKAGSNLSNDKRYVSQVARVVQTGSAHQIRFIPWRFIQVIRKYAEILLEAQQPLASIRTVRTAVTKLKPNSESLTPLHADFLQLCLLSKTYSAALPILKEDISELAHPEEYKLNHRDLLRYFYYGGLIYVGLKQFDNALEFFKLGFTTPAMVLSHIMIESYKKHNLVSLIVHGSIQPFPRYTSSIVQRHLKALCPQYNELVNAYSTNSTDEVHKVAEQHAETFRKDKNLGLVKQAIQALYRKNIKRHTQTYLTLSLGDIASSVKLNSAREAEVKVLRMIEDGEVFATINQKDGMVSFDENPEEYNTNVMMNVLDTQIHNSINIALKLRTVDEDIAGSVDYIQKTMHERGGGRWGEMDEFEMMHGARGPPGFRGSGPGGRKGRKGKEKGMTLAN